MYQYRECTAPVFQIVSTVTDEVIEKNIVMAERYNTAMPIQQRIVLMPEYDLIRYEDKYYPLRTIDVEGEGEKFTIGFESLKNILFTENHEYVNEAANAVDNNIYFYAPDELLTAHNDALAAFIAQETDLNMPASKMIDPQTLIVLTMLHVRANGASKNDVQKVYELAKEFDTRTKGTHWFNRHPSERSYEESLMDFYNEKKPASWYPIREEWITD